MLRTTRLSTFRRALSRLPQLEVVKEKFVFSSETSTIESLLEQKPEQVIVNGWIDSKPKKVSKNLIFGKLRDHQGNKIQLLDTESLLKECQVEDVVQITGTLAEKRSISSSKSDASDNKEYEVRLKEVKYLNRSNKKPSQLQELKSDDASYFPPEYRYLQLRLPRFQNNLRLRDEASKSARSVLHSLDFIEVETPLLFKSTPEGAREFLVPTRGKVDGNASFYALPQSPQQYKQLLMASGINRYFQIARCFRDEDLRSDRQPEFTQIDMEMAFSNGSDVRKVVEEVVTRTWNKLNYSGKNINTLNERGQIVPVTSDHGISSMTYHQAMTQYGIDKPDLRFPNLKILDLSEFRTTSQNPDFPVFEVLVLRNAFSTIEDFEKNWSMLRDEKNYNYRAPLVLPITKDDLKDNWFNEFLSSVTFENPKIVSRFLNLKRGDILIGSTREPTQRLFENPTPLGRARQLIIQSDKGKELFRETEAAVASWVVDFPLFSPVEETTEKKVEFPVYKPGAFCSTHHPFTMVNLRDFGKLESSPLSCLGEHYDLVVNGVELGGGSTRIHDPELQNYVFHEILQIKNPETLFGHLLNAFEMGTPPHAGFAIGFDRMCAMLCGTESIRDVIAFPKSVSGADLVVGSPSNVPDNTLSEYNIKSRLS